MQNGDPLLRGRNLADLGEGTERGAAGVDPPPEGGPPARVEQVSVEVEGASLTGDLTLPQDATGTVVFAHGSSSRHSPRNRFVAETLQGAGMATLLLDLLTPEEEKSRRDIR